MNISWISGCIMKTLFKNADILLFEKGIYNVIKNAYLAVDGDKISYIGKTAPDGDFDIIKDMSGKLLMSGLYNCHNHCPMVLLRGVGSDLPLNEWLFNKVFPIEDKLTADEIYAGTNPKNIEKVLDLVKIEIDKIVAEGVTDYEFLRGREQLKGGLLLSQENSANVMVTLAKNCLLADAKYSVEEKIAEVEAVTKEQVDQMAKLILDRKNVSLAIVSKTKPATDLLEKFKS